MTNVKDLRIEDEILPLFDFTFNYYSGKAVAEILLEPLASVADILFRQQVLKGFIENRAVLKEYSYSRFNLAELYDFLENFSVGAVSRSSLRFQLLFSEKKRHRQRGKLIQLILLFHKIYDTYTSKLNTGFFPAAYENELKEMNQFLADFKLDYFEAVIRKKKFKVGHMVELLGIIAAKTTSGQTAAFWKRWFLFEAHLSISRGMLKHGFVFPSFHETRFSIEGLYHPLLKNPVKNDLVPDKHVILLTGPNMSGKSTFLKAVSLCVYLGHTGVGVPASAAVMPFFSTISVAINLSDNIISGYSHFMTEIITLKEVLLAASAGKKCFAVFDELFRGTNIEDALEISTATVKGLKQYTESLFFISTHLHQLKEMEEVKTGQVKTWFIDCALTDNIPAFTYQLKEGWSDLKLGRVLFEKEGLYELLG